MVNSSEFNDDVEFHCVGRFGHGNLEWFSVAAEEGGRSFNSELMNQLLAISGVQGVHMFEIEEVSVS